MNYPIVCRIILFSGVVWSLMMGAAQAGNFDNEWFRIFGRWDGKELRADTIQLRLPEKDPSRGQVTGRIEAIDHQRQIMKIGPFAVAWNDRTEFDHIERNKVKAGLTVKVSGSMNNANQFIARKIALDANSYAPTTLQITGLSSSSYMREDLDHVFTVLNIPVHTPQHGYNTFKSLVRRQDVRRPDDQFKFDLFGKPVTLGGEYDFNPGFRENFDLDSNDKDSSLRIDQELKLEAFYPLSGFTAVFLSFKGVAESRFNNGEDAFDRTRFSVDRDETWIYFDRLFGTGLGLQFGNQNISETREWWWDKDMDALRLYYNQGPLHFELAGGKQIGGESTRQSIDNRDKEVIRILGLGSWMWNSKQRLELFFLHQWDSSSRDVENNLILRTSRDNFDDDMTWFGARAIGEIGLDDYGSVFYWGDFAGVHGAERVTDYDGEDREGNDLPSHLVRVDSVNERKVSGWAFDVGAFWTLPFDWQPTFTLSYARASGDTDFSDGTNGTFRQTGIQRNNWRFNGVNRFRIYGELLRPELSNIGIFTTSFGLRLLKNSSIELVYHKYDQVVAADFMRNANLNADPDGINRDIGQEINVIADFREWEHWEIGLEGYVFDPGKAFNKDNNDLAWALFFDVNYNF